MHARSEEFDATELRRARPFLETIDLRALELVQVMALNDSSGYIHQDPGRGGFFHKFWIGVCHPDPIEG